MPYIGGKSQAGVYQRIISLIPPHRVFLEPFFGGGAITRLKKRAEKTIVCDLDPRPLAAAPDYAETRCVNGVQFLRQYPFSGFEFVYCDPPYVLSSRGGRRYYRHEMTDDDHRALLDVLANRVTCPVMLSGYPSELYHAEGFSAEPSALRDGWHVETYRVMTRGHSWRTECLWWNYPRPSELHDFSHVGVDRRERWNIERCRRRWRARLARMKPLERATLFSALVDVMGAAAADAE